MIRFFWQIYYQKDYLSCLFYFWRYWRHQNKSMKSKLKLHQCQIISQRVIALCSDNVFMLEICSGIVLRMSCVKITLTYCQEEIQILTDIQNSRRHTSLNSWFMKSIMLISCWARGKSCVHFSNRINSEWSERFTTTEVLKIWHLLIRNQNMLFRTCSYMKMEKRTS